MGHIFLAPDKPWPNVDGMNAKCPKSEWGEYQGRAQGPWQRQRLVYFVDIDTMQKYTWPSRVETIGADICVREFREKVRLMRQFRGECVYAVVALRDTYMPTRFGGRQRPDLVPVRWIKLGPSETALPAPTTPALPSPDVQAHSDQPVKTIDPQSEIQTVEPPSLREQMNDEIPPFDDPIDINAPPAIDKKEPSTLQSVRASEVTMKSKPQMTKRGVQKIAGGRR
jgi:hypothetical protein